MCAHSDLLNVVYHRNAFVSHNNYKIIKLYTQLLSRMFPLADQTYIYGAIIKRAPRSLKCLEHCFPSRGQHLQAAREKRKSTGLARSALRGAGVRDIAAIKRAQCTCLASQGYYTLRLHGLQDIAHHSSASSFERCSPNDAFTPNK